MVGLTASILVNAATKRVSVVEISQFAAKRVVTVATEAKAAAERQIVELQERSTPSSPGFGYFMNYVTLPFSSAAGGGTPSKTSPPPDWTKSRTVS